MLSGLSSLLFGNNATDDAAVGQTQASQPVDLDTKEGEMGWVLVDVPGRSDLPEGKEDDDAIVGGDSHEEKNARHLPRKCSRVKNSVSPTHSCRRLVCVEEGHNDSDHENHDIAMDLELYEHIQLPRLHNQLGESWLLTPPPCFTGAGGVSQLQSSPLENLLIEHPSMSVYRHNRCFLQDMEEETDQENQPGQGEQPNHRPQAATNANAVQQRPQPSARAVRACTGAAEQMKVTRYQQRHQQALAGKQLSHKCLDRSNKTLIVQGTRRHLSARNRASHPSGAKSGRRSQRVH